MDAQFPEFLSDCIDGALHPVQTADYFGHDDQIHGLEQRLIRQKLHHGWIFCGPRGVGKATLAYHFARVLLGFSGRLEAGQGLLAASSAVRAEKAGRLIGHFAHPDMRVLRRSYETKTKKFNSFIRIDEMRACREMLNTTASMGGYRFVLIDKAEDMNEATSNALLKMLEEPPARTVFVLIADAPGQIPVTVRSRCQLLKFHGMEFENFKAALVCQLDQYDGETARDFDWLDVWHLADGSVGAGFELLTGKGLLHYQLLLKLMESLPVIDGRLLNQFIEGVLRDKSGQDYKDALQMMRALLARLIKGQAAGLELSARELRLKDQLVKRGAIDQWIVMWDTLFNKSLEVEEYNLDKKTHLMTSFFALRDLVRAG